MQAATAKEIKPSNSALPAQPEAPGAPVPAGESTPLPNFIQRRAEGLFITPGALETQDRLRKFVERIFSEGRYFADLDYAVFDDALFAAGSAEESGRPVRLAADIRNFEPSRRGLYKGIAVINDGKSAHYMFEPVFIEDEDDSGDAQSAASRLARAKPQPATLDVGEFIAHAWNNGIRFGIDVTRVREAIDKSERGRVAIAQWREPAAGTDAGIEEKSPSLHRDDSPMTNADGQVDLGQFKNRFPQVKAGELLFRKTPRKLGEPGRTLGGDLVECEMPKDFEMPSVAGPGTKCESRDDGQFIVAEITGFIDIDKASNRVSVSEKMVGREGVSMRTTGNLRLSGAAYEEHGEVDAKRVIKGKDMSFLANVYGCLVSDGGEVTLAQNLINGTVRNPRGQIIARGLCSASTLEAPGGTLRLKRAEGCVIWGQRVEIEHAVCCEIIASEAVLGTAEGCSVTAQSADIEVAGAFKGRETALTLLVPVRADDKEKREQAQKQLLQLQARIQAMTADKETLEAKKDFGEFLKLQAVVARGAVKLSSEHATAFRQLHARMAPLSQRYSALLLGLTELRGELEKTQPLVDSLDPDAGPSMPIRCAIASITGETVVQNLHCILPEIPMDENSLQQLRSWLHGNNQSPLRLFARDGGSFTWRYRHGNAVMATRPGISLGA